MTNNDKKRARYNWYLRSVEETQRQLDVDPKAGLATGEVERRQRKYGSNVIEEGRRRSVLRMLLGQFTDFMVIVLLVAAVVSGLIGEIKDAIAILVIVFLNAGVGAIQEYRAERAITALRKMAMPETQVRRDGRLKVISIQAVVPGDIVLLEDGNIVPADLRLLEVADLKIDESALTGESVTVGKQAGALDETDLPLGDRNNMAYKGTVVSYGHGIGVVVATGMATELGRIASLIKGAESVKTPLQKRLARFGQRLAIAVLIICAIIFTTGLLRGEPLMLMLLTAVSLAVAAIPEALPAVVTLSLALGARKMTRQKALVRSLPAVETLGSVTRICADKTGTLTENRMTADIFYAQGEIKQSLPKMTARTELMDAWQLLGQAMSLNNNTEISSDGKVTGEPTEVALRQGAEAAGYQSTVLKGVLPRMDEIPFDADRKRMSTIHRDRDGTVVFTKGAPESVLDRCISVWGAQGPDDVDKDQLRDQAAAMAGEGLSCPGIRNETVVEDTAQKPAVET